MTQYEVINLIIASVEFAIAADKLDQRAILPDILTRIKMELQEYRNNLPEDNSPFKLPDGAKKPEEVPEEEEDNRSVLVYNVADGRNVMKAFIHRNTHEVWIATENMRRASDKKWDDWYYFNGTVPSDTTRRFVIGHRADAGYYKRMGYKVVQPKSGKEII